MMSREDEEPMIQTESSHRSPFQRLVQFFKNVFNNVTIEPMLFIKTVAEGIFIVVGNTLEIDRVCLINLHFNETDCQLMDDGNHTDIQDAVQIYKNTFNYHQTLMSSFIPLIVIIFVGPLSDKYGRKPAMILPIIGLILYTLVHILEAIFVKWPVEVLYVGSLGLTLGGTWVVFNMAVYSYLADITTRESRTKRMGIADSVWGLGFPLGTFLGGILYKYYGYVAVYATSCTLLVICLLYVIFLIKEERPQTIEPEDLNKMNPLSYLKQLFRTVVKNRPNGGRTSLLALIALRLGLFFVYGHQTYLWARKVLQWDTIQFSIWESVEVTAGQITGVGWFWFVDKIGFHDCTTAGFGIFSMTLWSITLSFITGPALWWLVIVASTLGLVGVVNPLIRSMLTNITRRGEEGKILTVLSMIEAAWLSVDMLIFTMLYNHFVDVFPQINFVVQSFFGVILLFSVYALKKSFQRADYEAETDVDTSYTQFVGHST